MSNENDESNIPRKSIMDEINEPLEDETASDSADVPQKRTLSQALSHPDNKKLKLMIIGCAIIICSVLAMTAFQFFKGEPAPKKNNQQVAGGVLPTGVVNEQSRREIEEYNNELSEVRKNNPVAQPLALENINNKADENPLLMNPECKKDDTACMRASGDIGQDECAPEDNNCLKEKDIESKKKSAATHNDKESKPSVETDEYSERIKDKEYMKVLNDHFKQASDTKPTETGFILKDSVPNSDDSVSDKSGTKTVAQAGNKESILKPVSDVEDKKIQMAGDRLMAVSDIALNSDIEGPVSLTILNGNYPDSIMIGKSTRVDDYMRLELTNWVHQDGKECEINVIALDKETTYAAIQSHVDHHVLYRYGFWGLGTVLGAIGKAAQNNADKEIVISNGIALESTKSDATRETKMAVGELGQEIGRIMQKRIDRPSTVHVKRNEEMGVFFLKSVLESNCK